MALEWMTRALCIGADPELWFPLGKGGPADEQAAHVKARYCRPCPVQGECLSYAFAAGVSDGIWGGTTRDERAAYERRERRRARGTTPKPPQRDYVPAADAAAIIARSGMSDADLAKSTGIGVETVSKIRRGKRDSVNRKTLDRLLAGVGA